MQTYRHARTIEAAKITAVAPNPDGSAVLTVEGGDTYPVEKRWVSVQTPRAGGYLVGADTGRQTYWAADQFEATYVLLPA